MKYIENVDLREWVKDNLRRTIFQKAHEFAVQTGCGVMVKLQTEKEDVSCHTYASPGVYDKLPGAKAWQKVWDISVCGETGLPYPDMTDREVQSQGVSGSASEVAIVGSASESALQIKSVTSLHNTGSAGPCVGINTESVAIDSNLQQSTQVLRTRPGGQSVVADPNFVADNLQNQHALVATSGNIGFTNVLSDNLNIIQQSGMNQLTSVQVAQLQSRPNKAMPTLLLSGQTAGQMAIHVTKQSDVTDTGEANSSGFITLKQSVEPSKSLPMRIRQYQCGSCRKAFSNSSVLQAHVRIYHSKKHLRYPCKYCDAVFTHPHNLAKHINKHHEMRGPDTRTSKSGYMTFRVSNSQRLPQCSHPATTKGKDHPVVSSNIIPETDASNADESAGNGREECEKVVIVRIKEEPPDISNTDQISIAHENVTTVEPRTHNSNTESVPGTSFIANPSLSVQRSTSSSVSLKLQGIRASSSSKQLVRRGRGRGQPALQRHHACDICSKVYKNSSHLKEHRMTHFGERPFLCEVCNHRFFRQRQLRDHQFTHSGEFPYVCDVCNKGFVRPATLRNHKLSHNSIT